MKLFTRILYKLSIAIFLVNVLACQTKKKDVNNVIPVEAYYNRISVAKNLQLIDVRTSSEFIQGHIKLARNIDWLNSEFISEIVKLDKSKAVYIYCQSGGRSASALKKMRDLGFKEVYDLEGGFYEWQKANKLSEKN